MNTQTQQRIQAKEWWKSLRVQGHTILHWKRPLEFPERWMGAESFWGHIIFSNSRGKVHIQKRLESHRVSQQKPWNTEVHRAMSSNIKRKWLSPWKSDSLKIQIKCESRKRAIFKTYHDSKVKRFFIGIQRRSALLKEGHKWRDSMTKDAAQGKGEGNPQDDEKQGSRVSAVLKMERASSPNWYRDF